MTTIVNTWDNPAKYGTVLEVLPTGWAIVANGRGGTTTIHSDYATDTDTAAAAARLVDAFAAEPEHGARDDRPTGRVAPVPTTPTTRSDAPSEKQTKFLRSLLAEREGIPAAEGVRSTLNRHREAGTLTKKVVSLSIEALLAIPRNERSKPESVEIAEGFYEVDGTVYKVQRAVHGSGNLYGKRLVVSDDKKGEFVYEAGVPRRLANAGAQPLTLDRAKELGHLYGICCVCSRTLTNEDSIRAGIGPWCATKF